MYKFENKTLIDDIFIGNFIYKNLNYSSKNLIKNVNLKNSLIITKNELIGFKKKSMYKCLLYKKEPFYILLNGGQLKNINYNEIVEKYKLDKVDGISNITDDLAIQNIFNPIFELVKNFYYDVSLKEFNFSIEEHKFIDFSKVPKKDKSIYGYVIVGQIIIDDANVIDFYILIPLAMLRFLIFFLTNKDISKLSKRESLIKLIEELELNFISAKSFFPFYIGDFFNTLTETDTQRIINILLSSNMLSYDMLYALSRSIKDGTNKILGSLSKRLKDEYLQNVREKGHSFDDRWVEVANYHTLSNVKNLLETRKFESTILNSFKDILNNINLRISEKILKNKKFSDWVEDARNNKIIHNVFSQLKLITVASSLCSEKDDTINLFEGCISNRAFKDLREDVHYIRKKSISYIEQLIAKQEFIYTYAGAMFDKLDEDDKKLENYINFKNDSDINHIFNYIGPVDFSIASMELKEKEKRNIIKKLNAPAKYFVEDLLMGKIKLNTNYNKNIIERKALYLAKEIYKLNLVGRIEIIPPEKNME